MTLRKSARRSGFVLLFTLVVIGISALLLTKLVRKRLELSLAVIDKSQAFQERWGNVSLRRSLLLEARTVVALEPSRRWEEHVILGDIPFHLLVSDESTKINLNRLYQQGGSKLVESLLSTYVKSGIELRPQNSGGRVSQFRSWGEVFDLTSFPSGDTLSGWLPEKTQDITCWGDGRFHFRATRDELLRSVLLHVLDEELLTKYLKTRTLNPNLSLSELMESMALDPAKKRELEQWLTEESQAYTIFITAPSGGGWHGELNAVEFPSFGPPEVVRFVW